jgi:hypothetical protein
LWAEAFLGTTRTSSLGVVAGAGPPAVFNSGVLVSLPVPPEPHTRRRQIQKSPQIVHHVTYNRQRSTQHMRRNHRSEHACAAGDRSIARNVCGDAVQVRRAQVGRRRGPGTQQPNGPEQQSSEPAECPTTTKTRSNERTKEQTKPKQRWIDQPTEAQTTHSEGMHAQASLKGFGRWRL